MERKSAQHEQTPIIDKKRETFCAQPIRHTEYGREGNIKVENESIALELSYEFADYNTYAKEIDGRNGLLSDFPRSDFYRKLSGYVIIDKKTGVPIDLLSDLPEGQVVLFNNK